MKLPPALAKLSKIKHAKIIGIILTLLIDISFVVGLIYIPSQALYLVLMIGTVAVTFFVPWLFGIRDGKRLALVGVIIFLVIGAINGPLVVHTMYSDARYEYENPPFDTSPIDNATGDYLAMSNATLEPLVGDAGGAYTFSIWYYSNDTPPTGRVSLLYRKSLFLELVEKDMEPANNSDTDYSDGKLFIYESTSTDFDRGIFVHTFQLNFTSRSVFFPGGDRWLYGPMSGDEASQYPFYAGVGALSMFCNIGLLFIIVVLLYWWLGSAKEKRKQWQEAMKEDEDASEETVTDEDADEADSEESEDDEETITDEPEDDLAGEEFTCTSCGAPVSAMHNFCPNCGERFDGIEDEVETKTGEEAENESQ